MIIRSPSKYEMVIIDENFMENDAFVHLNLEDDTEEKLSTMSKCVDDLLSEQKISVNLFYME